MARLLISSLILLLSAQSYGSSCCGQSVSSYTVLSLGQKSSFSLNTGYTEVLGRVFDGSNDFNIWTGDKKAYKKRLGLDWAYSFSERHQVFSNISFIGSTYADEFGEETTSSPSDGLLGYSYEILPEYTYSKWKPVVYLSSFVNLPFGTSTYDKDSLSEGAGVTGHDQFGLGFGLSLRKVFFPVTVLTQFKVVRLLPGSFGDIEVSGFYDASASALATYAAPLWNLGLSLGVTWAYLSKRKILSEDILSGASDSWSVMASVQKVLSDELSVSVSYSDQSLLGTPQNTLLSKVYSLNLNYNFF